MNTIFYMLISDHNNDIVLMFSVTQWLYDVSVIINKNPLKSISDISDKIA